MADIAILIPAFNCERSIADVVCAAHRYVQTVIVVSDGSADATAERALAAGAEVVRHPTNLGKGAALQTGMQLLAERGFERVLTMDGDGQHLSHQIPVLLEVSDSDRQALVIGARRVEPEVVDPIRLFANRFANRWVEIACGQKLPDTQSGFRIYPLRKILTLGARAAHFGFETEVVIRAVRAGVSIRSVPVEVYYPPARARISHYRPFLDTVRIIFIVLGLILRVR